MTARDALPSAVVQQQLLTAARAGDANGVEQALRQGADPQALLPPGARGQPVLTDPGTSVSVIAEVFRTPPIGPQARRVMQMLLEACPPGRIPLATMYADGSTEDLLSYLGKKSLFVSEASARSLTHLCAWLEPWNHQIEIERGLTELAELGWRWFSADFARPDRNSEFERAKALTFTCLRYGASPSLALSAHAGEGVEFAPLMNHVIQRAGSTQAVRTTLLALDDVADLVRSMLARGFDPDVANTRGITPLMLAAQYDNRPMIEMLLHAGADPRARDAYDRDAISHAHSDEARAMISSYKNALMAREAADNALRRMRDVTPAMAFRPR